MEPLFYWHKERRTAINRLKKQIVEIEASMTEHEAEREAIYAHYLANPTDHDVEKKTRLDEPNRILPEEEQRWLALGDE